MKLALLSPVAALAAFGLAACGDAEVATDAAPTQNELAASENPDYRYNPPGVTPDLNQIAPPTEVTPRPLQPTDPTAPPPASPPPPIPESIPGAP